MHLRHCSSCLHPVSLGICAFSPLGIQGLTVASVVLCFQGFCSGLQAESPHWSLSVTDHLPLYARMYAPFPMTACDLALVWSRYLVNSA